MLEQPKYIQNTFAIIFPKQTTIRRQANALEDQLKGKYFQPQIVPVPDNLDPEVPRMIFGSEHGFSQIVVSQLNIILNVSYSPDWQVDIAKGKAYILERVGLLFDVYPQITKDQPFYCGLSTRVRLQNKETEQETFRLLQKAVGTAQQDRDLYDLQLRKTIVLDGFYFNNVVISNYRTWKLDDADLNVVALPKKDVIEQGIEITADFNDRYSFSENKAYRTNRDQANKIIERGFAAIISLVEGVSKQ